MQISWLNLDQVAGRLNEVGSILAFIALIDAFYPRFLRDLDETPALSWIAKRLQDWVRAWTPLESWAAIILLMVYLLAGKTACLLASLIVLMILISSIALLVLVSSLEVNIAPLRRHILRGRYSPGSDEDLA